jgi:RND superfamily putative drug exporter
MELLGERNWWLPGWLDRLLPHVHVDGVDGNDGTEDELQVHDDTDREPPVPAGAGA